MFCIVKRGIMIFKVPILYIFIVGLVDMKNDVFINSLKCPLYICTFQ